MSEDRVPANAQSYGGDGRASLNGPKPLAVLLVISRLDGTGGAGRSVAELTCGLKRAGVRAELACFRHSSRSLEEDLLREGVPLHVLEVDHLPTAIWRLRRLIRDRRPDLVHTTMYAADQAGRLAALGTGTPVLSTITTPTHDPARDETAPLWRRRLLWALDGWTSRHLTSRIHAITYALKDSAVRGLGVRPDRVTVVYRSRDEERLGEPSEERRRTVRRALGLENATVVLTLGRQAPEKGQTHLLDAFALVVAAHPSAVLLVAGARGSATPALEAAMRERGIEASVRFLGHREDVGDLLAAADAFAFPSLFEGLGGALIEAMALGTPIVASDLPAVREVTGDGAVALLVPPGDPAALASALMRLLEDPILASELADAGRSRHRECFTPEVVTAGLIDLYREVVSER
jgi:glycosyltransferase involved in cell wall biosynthesis